PLTSISGAAPPPRGGPCAHGAPSSVPGRHGGHRSGGRIDAHVTFRRLIRGAAGAAMPFTADHDALRESIRDFVTKELRPHAEEWEEAEYFADWVFPRMGELGLLGLRYPEAYGGQGGDY